LAISRGSADSEDEVAKISRYSRARYRSHQLEDRDPREGAQDRPEHAEDEHQAGQVERQHQHAELRYRIQPRCPDDTRHGAERADRGEPENHAEDLEHEFLDVADPAQQRLSRLTHRLNAESHQQRDEEGLQHTSGSQGGQQRRRDDALHEVAHSAGAVRSLGVLGRGRRGRRAKVQPGSRVDEVADQQPDAQRHGGHAEEVGQRDTTDFAHLRGRLDRPDAQHDGAKDDGADHHLDQADEHRAEDADRCADPWSQPSDENARDDRDEDAEVQPVGAVPPGCLRRWGALLARAGAAAHATSS